MTKRYIISEACGTEGANWTHIFTEGGRDRERNVAFVWDTQESRIIDAQILRENRWDDASPQEIADLTDSLVNANAQALTDPEGWSLEGSDKRPYWVPDGGADASPCP